MTRDPLDGFPRFAAEVRSRLEAGRREYGDRSFSRPLERLLDEVREELLDVAGWSYVLACRLEQVREALKAVNESDAPPAATPRPRPEASGQESARRCPAEANGARGALRGRDDQGGTS